MWHQPICWSGFWVLLLCGMLLWLGVLIIVSLLTSEINIAARDPLSTSAPWERAGPRLVYISIRDSGACKHEGPCPESQLSHCLCRLTSVQRGWEWSSERFSTVPGDIFVIQDTRFHSSFKMWLNAHIRKNSIPQEFSARFYLDSSVKQNSYSLF